MYEKRKTKLGSQNDIVCYCDCYRNCYIDIDIYYIVSHRIGGWSSIGAVAILEINSMDIFPWSLLPVYTVR